MLRKTFGVRLGEGDDYSSSDMEQTTVGAEGSGLSRSACVNCTNRQQQPPGVRGRSSAWEGEYDGHPGTRVLGLCTIDSCGGTERESRLMSGAGDGELCGGEKKARGSVLSNRGDAAVGSTSFLWVERSMDRSISTPERPYLRDQAVVRLKGEQK